MKQTSITYHNFAFVPVLNVWHSSCFIVDVTIIARVSLLVLSVACSSLENMFQCLAFLFILPIHPAKLVFITDVLCDLKLWCDQLLCFYFFVLEMSVFNFILFLLFCKWLETTVGKFYGWKVTVLYFFSGML